MVEGPFKVRHLSTLRVSPLSIIPNKTPGKYRIIHHLSFPDNASVNDFIDPSLCSVTYTKFDKAVDIVQKLGPRSEIAKADIKHAFQLLIVKPGDLDLLCFKIYELYYYGKTMPMGGKISCATFENFSTFFEWAVKQVSGEENIIHYLDDFSFAGKSGTSDCQKRLDEFKYICNVLKVPIAEEKTEGPITKLCFFRFRNILIQTI